jgi:hypothetical protein
MIGDILVARYRWKHVADDPLVLPTDQYNTAERVEFFDQLAFLSDRPFGDRLQPNFR